MVLSKEEFPRNLPEQYRKHFEELYESTNAIVLTLSKVEDEKWKRKLAGMCIVALTFQEFPDVKEQLDGKVSERETVSYIS
jgi:hypothetical protein